MTLSRLHFSLTFYVWRELLGLVILARLLLTSSWRFFSDFCLVSALRILRYYLYAED
uniref:Uncharacterized protein n=1 Tax=Meloidogyne enterolobii TaxID=390850 RepID=A0A6V7VUZ0_MELEN|nr:unnamed protein product [Meloidogyne enterolobii]